MEDQVREKRSQKSPEASPAGLLTKYRRSRELLTDSDLSRSFFEVLNRSLNPYRFFMRPSGYLSYSQGEGDFGLLVYKEPLSNFILEGEVLVPEGCYEYVNSGIYLQFMDPRIDLSKDEVSQLPSDSLLVLNNRSQAFIADWTGYEVQLISGPVELTLPQCCQNGSIYNVSIGTEEGNQEHTSFSYHSGQSYHFFIHSAPGLIEVWMKNTRDLEYSFVSRLKFDDSVRGKSPGFWGIQSYFNDGKKAKSFDFRNLVIHQL